MLRTARCVSSMHMNVEKPTSVCVCLLYGSLCAPLLLPWPGELEGTSLAMAQGKASPVLVVAPIFRVPTVLQRVPSAVPPTVVAHGRLIPAIRERLGDVRANFTGALPTTH